jgi:class 3 adenylate cyclase
MRLLGDETCPLPAEPTLRDAATALAEAGAWGMVFDSGWRLVYMTDDMRLSNGLLRELVPLPLEARYFCADAIDFMLQWPGEMFSIDAYRAAFGALAPWVVADAPGGAEEVRGYIDPRLADLVEAPPDSRSALTWTMSTSYSAGGPAVALRMTAMRLRDESGRTMGTAIIVKPAAGMSVLGVVAGAGDLGHFHRIQRVAKASRRPAAILFADLEASSPLSRRLSTSGYFRLGRRLVRAADQVVIDREGVVGRHAGDGVVAFFLVHDAGSESAAARNCIEAMRDLRGATASIAERSGLAPEEVVMRFGLHWGGTLHVGQVITVARAEVNALGDEVNEAARIEACATGGRALASKALIERLDPPDADALGIDPASVAYTALAELPTATEKARRDAPSIAVCEV